MTETRQATVGDQIRTQSYHIEDIDGFTIFARVLSVHIFGVWAEVESVMNHSYPSKIFRSWDEFEIVSLEA